MSKNLEAVLEAALRLLLEEQWQACQWATSLPAMLSARRMGCLSMTRSTSPAPSV
jgi:hypothetical protein